MLTSKVGDKVSLAVAATKAAVEDGIKSGDVVKVLGEYVDGKGGGKPDLAQGSGAKPEGIPAALSAVRDWLRRD